MRKIFTIGVVALCAIGLLATGAMAQINEFSNVAQTSKRGSLLIFPKVDTRTNFDPLTNVTYDRDTIIAIGNDGAQQVELQCIWKYPLLSLVDKRDNSRADQLFPTQDAAYREFEQTCCDEEDFTISLTPNQVVYFSAGTGIANVLSGKQLIGSTNRIPAASRGIGALTCFAIKGAGNKTPISYNRLYGEAQIIRFELTSGAVFNNGLSAWGYNAWGFEARARQAGSTMGAFNAADNSWTLPLRGRAGTYNACPDMLTFNFFARQSFPGTTNLPILGSDITLYPCTQDLREFPTPGDPKKETETLAVFSIWNANEDQFSGTQACIKCWFEQTLGVTDKGRAYRQAGGGFSPDPFDLEGTNFGFRLPDILDAFQFVKGDNFIFLPVQGGLGTLYGRARVDTFAAQGCGVAPIKTPLVGVMFDFWDLVGGFNVQPLDDSIGLGNDGVPEATAGRNMTGRGLEEAFIRYNNQP